MNILWITNAPIVNGHLKMLNIEALSGSGGWVQSSLSILSQVKGLSIVVAAPYKGCASIREEVIDGITYILLPTKNNIFYSNKLEHYWKNVQERFNPDIIHIHGSEFPVGLAYVNACGSKGVVLSIQGLVSEILKYNLSGLSAFDILRSITLKDFLTGKILYLKKIELKIRAHYELKLIANVENIIGRTNWDRCHTYVINNSARYFKLEEMLRTPFINSQKWNYNECKPHSIFVSQAYVPLKGLHFLLQALKIVREKFPDTTVTVAGSNLIKGNVFTRRGYGKIIYKLINKLNLQDSIRFVSPLTAEQMAMQLRSANCYVLCSSIENSPNSVCEAQMIGTPVVASFVGGVPDFVKDRKTGFLYRFDDISILADDIINVFKSRDNVKKISCAEIDEATQRHNSLGYGNQLIEIYNEIINRDY